MFFFFVFITGKWFCELKSDDTTPGNTIVPSKIFVRISKVEDDEGKAGQNVPLDAGQCENTGILQANAKLA